MPPADRSVPRKGTWASWLALGLFGLLATGAGICVPRLVPGEHSRPPEMAAALPGKPAPDPLEYSPPAVPDFPSPARMLLRLVLGTVVVLVLCVGTLWTCKRYLGPRVQPAQSSNELRLLETLPLNSRCSIYLLQAGRSRALAGVDATGLKVLLTLPEPFEEMLVDGAEAASGATDATSLPHLAG